MAVSQCNGVMSAATSWFVTAGASAGTALAASVVYLVGLLSFKWLVDADDDVPLATLVLTQVWGTDDVRRPVRYGVALLSTAGAFTAALLTWAALGPMLSFGPIVAGLGGLLLGETLLQNYLTPGDTAGRLSTLTHGIASVAGVATLVAAVSAVRDPAVTADQSAVANFLVSLRPEALLVAAAAALAIRYAVGAAEVTPDRVWRQTVLVCLAVLGLGLGTSGLVVPESATLLGVVYAGLWALLWIVMIACVNGYLSDEGGTPITSIPNPDGQTTKIE